jgi:phosphate transport system permease protein
MATGDWPHGGTEYRSIYAVGTVLFAVTMVFNLLAYGLVRRFRSAHE